MRSGDSFRRLAYGEGEIVAKIDLRAYVLDERNIDADLRDCLKAFSDKIKTAMNTVGADMQVALAQHIESDVYKAYPNPVEYERRKENGGLIAQARQAKIYNHGSGVSLEYKPDGMHENPAWHTADADDLIGRIERKSPPYFPKAQERVPERPFWQNFVSEMVDEGMAEHFFAEAMRQLGEDVTEDGTIFREPNDGEY